MKRITSMVASRAPIPVCALLLAGVGFASRTVEAANNCLSGDFVDLRGHARVEVANDDPVNPFRYRPRCARISEATTVVFHAQPNFGVHPLFGGAIENGKAVIDPDSPIGSITAGSETERFLTTNGEFPFFCDIHWQDGMAGSILVVPELFANGFDGH